jgi:hypothetical protein
LEHGSQGRVGINVSAAGSGSDLNLFDQLGKQLAPLGVSGALLVLDRCPF